MSVLGRYLVGTVLAYTGLVLLVLMALGALFLFIGQQDDIGVGEYSAQQAMLFVALNLPAYLVQLLPVGALIGALLGLGNLARGSELVVMRSAGVSTARLCGWLGLAGIVLAALMLVLGEFVAPPLGKYARQVKVFSKFNEFSFAGNRGTWVRDGDTIVSIDQQTSRSLYGGVLVFRFGPDRELAGVARAESAQVGSDRRWRLEGFRETRFVDGRAQVEAAPYRDIESSLSPEFLGLAVVEPETMGLRDLRAYIEYLERNDLDTNSFEIAYWSRISRLVAVVLVAMLALAFATGTMRSSGQGARAVAGILIGAGFVLLSRTLESSGRLFDLPPAVVGWAPTVLLAAITFALLARTSR